MKKVNNQKLRKNFPISIRSATQSLKIAYWSIIIALVAIGGIFYWYQNYADGLGGKIALPKLIWLAYALWFWYFLPLLLGVDRRINSALRKAYWIFWSNMLIRAFVELWLMYGTQTWHPYLGITHNLFSIFLVYKLHSRTKELAELDKVVRFNFRISGSIFLPESFFAWYMLSYVNSTAGPVYFVPASDRHFGIMLVTWIVILALTAQQFIFVKRWLYVRSN